MMYVSALPRTSESLEIGGLLTAATTLVTVFKAGQTRTLQSYGRCSPSNCPVRCINVVNPMPDSEVKESMYKTIITITSLGYISDFRI